MLNGPDLTRFYLGAPPDPGCGFPVLYRGRTIDGVEYTVYDSSLDKTFSEETQQRARVGGELQMGGTLPAEPPSALVQPMRTQLPRSGPVALADDRYRNRISILPVRPNWNGPVENEDVVRSTTPSCRNFPPPEIASRTVASPVVDPLGNAAANEWL